MSNIRWHSWNFLPLPNHSTWIGQWSSSSAMRRYELLQIQKIYIIFSTRKYIYIYIYLFILQMLKSKLSLKENLNWDVTFFSSEGRVDPTLNMRSSSYSTVTFAVTPCPRGTQSSAGSFWAPNLRLWPLIASLTVLIG